MTLPQEFLWTDNSRRAVRYNSPVQLQAAVETDFAIGKRFALGLGLQAGLTKYEVDNVFLEQSADYTGALCGPVGCPIIEEYVTSTVDARTVSGYLSLRVVL